MISRSGGEGREMDGVVRWGAFAATGVVVLSVASGMVGAGDVLVRLGVDNSGGFVSVGIAFGNVGIAFDNVGIAFGNVGMLAIPAALSTPAKPATPTPDAPNIGDASPDLPPTDTSRLFPYCLPASTTGTATLATTLETREQRPLGNRVIY